MRWFRLTLALLLVLCPKLAALADQPKLSREQVATAVAALDQLAAQTIQSTGVPGMAIAIVHGDEVVFLKGYGVREAGQPERVDADTVFQVASVSKPLASTVLAALEGEGSIGWDDHVIDHDPAFRLFDPWITRELRLRDLLCHRSGLPDHCGDLLEDLGYDRAEVLRRLRFQPPAGSFRAHYAYTNFGYTEACVAAARAVGKSWEDLAAEKLYRPLGMTASSSRYDDFARHANRARPHVREGNGWVAKHTRQPDAQSPAGGASSTARDLARWLRLHLANGKFEGRQLITAEALVQTREPQIVTGFDAERGRLTTYALGWITSIERGGRTFHKHSGAFSLGIRTEVALLPSEGLGLAVLSNAANTGLPEAMTESFFDLVLDGRLERDWVEFANRMFAEEMQRELSAQTDYTHPPAEKLPPAALSAYVGTYANDFYGPLEVAERAGGLEVRLGPKKMPFALTHWNRDVFIFQPSGEMAGGPTGAIFTLGPDGKAARVLIEYYNTSGLGTFERKPE